MLQAFAKSTLYDLSVACHAAHYAVWAQERQVPHPIVVLTSFRPFLVLRGRKVQQRNLRFDLGPPTLEHMEWHGLKAIPDADLSLIVFQFFWHGFEHIAK